jgi:hypothetical protein
MNSASNTLFGVNLCCLLFQTIAAPAQMASWPTLACVNGVNAVHIVTLNSTCILNISQLAVPR